MKKQHLIIFFGFIISFLVVDRLSSLFLNSLLNKSTLPHAKFYAGNGQTKIMILGNSRAYRGFDENYFSKITKRKTINYSLLGASMQIQEIIIKDYLDIYNEYPEVILIELSSLTEGGNDAIKEFRAFGYKSKRVSNFVKNKYPKIYYGGKVSNLFQFNNTTFFNAIYKIFIPYEFKTLKGVMNSIGDINTIKKNTFNINNDYYDENIKSLNRIINLCEEKNIKLYLVIIPYYPERLKFEENEYNRWVKNINENIKNISIINFAKSLNEIKYFYDWKHLNKEGTEKFQEIFFNHEYSKTILF